MRHVGVWVDGEGHFALFGWILTDFVWRVCSGLEECARVLCYYGGRSFGVSVRAFRSGARVSNSCRCSASCGVCRLCRFSRVRSVLLELCLRRFGMAGVVMAYVWVGFCRSHCGNSVRF